MSRSAALLSQTDVRLGDIEFPASRVQVHRTRLAFIHLDNLLHFSKADRDGRIDGFIAGYLPDEVAVLFLRRGELVTAIALTAQGREVQPVPVIRQRMEKELERGELVFCEAPMEQLVWMFGSCSADPRVQAVDPSHPEVLFKTLRRENFSGVLEFISNGRVNYLHFTDGKFVRGHFCGKRENVSVPRFMEGLFAKGADGKAPALAAALYDPPASLQPQAAPERIAKTRTLFWSIVDAAEAQVPGEVLKRVEKLRDDVAKTHPSLAVVAAKRKGDPPPLVVTPDELTYGLADWTKALLDELEIMAPGVAPEVLKAATREYRFVLQKAGFYSRLPWSVHW